MREGSRTYFSLGPYLGIGVQSAGLGLGFVSNFLLARLLGPDGYGVYGFAYSLVAFLSIPVQAGLATLLIKDITRYRVSGDMGHLHGLLRASIAIVVVVSTISAALLFVFAHAQRDRAFSVYVPVVAVAAILLPLMSMAAIRGGILRGLGRPIAGLLPDAILRPGLLALFVVVAIAYPGFSMTSAKAMALHAAAAAIAMGFGIYMVRRYLPDGILKISPHYEWRSWLTALVPLSLLAGIQAVSSVVATFALGKFHPPEELGFYRVAELGASLVSMPLSAVAAYSAGNVAQLFASAQPEKLQQEVTLSGRIALTGALPMALLLIFGGGALLDLALGDKFGPAVLPMAILCCGQVVNASAGLGGVVATMSGRYREANKAFGLALLVQIVGSLILVPKYGALGSAISAAMATTVWSNVLRHRMIVLEGIDTFALRGILRRKGKE